MKHYYSIRGNLFISFSLFMKQPHGLMGWTNDQPHQTVINPWFNGFSFLPHTHTKKKKESNYAFLFHFNNKYYRLELQNSSEIQFKWVVGVKG